MYVPSNELFKQTEVADQSDASSLIIDKEFGEGLATRIVVKEGVWIWSNDFCFNDDVCILEEEGLHDYVWIHINLSGSVNFSYQNRTFNIKPGHSAVLVGESSGTCLKQEIEKGRRCRIVGVLFDRQTFKGMTGRKPDEIFELSRLELSGRKRKAPPAMLNVTEQLLTSDFEIVDRKLFLEAKVLEFVAYRLGVLDKYRPEERKTEPNYPTVTERVFYAAELLERKMNNPPGIFELSRSVGLNHINLTRGFKNILGRTPYDYLSKIRLKKAAELIGSGESNVTDAAFSVGYSNLSHFAKIFRSEFGMNPKEYAKLRTKSPNSKSSV